jgi:triphosphatase
MIPRTETSRVETEWQFAARDLQSVRDYLQRRTRIAGFRLIRREPVDLTDRYLDTDDSRLARAGYALRLRTLDAACEATLKGLQRQRTVPACRREISQTIDLDSAGVCHTEHGPVLDRVRAVIGTETLKMLFMARTHRDVYDVMDNDVEAAEIDLDATEIVTNGAEPARRLQRVEVELRNAKLQSLKPLVRQLRERSAIEPVAVSKFEVGLSAAGRSLPAPPDPGVLAVMPNEAADVAGRLLLRQQLDVWRFLEPSARLADDPEALHRLRVTGRRLIATLRLLQSARVAGSHRPRTHLQKLLSRTSTARNLDVQIAEISAVNRLTRNRPLQTLVDELGRRRAREQLILLRALNSPGTARLFAALNRLAEFVPRVHSRRTVAQIARQQIRHRHQNLRKAALHVVRHPSAGRCHVMRLEVKNMRYVAELLAPTYGAPMRRFLRRLQKLQEVLGRINDTHHTLGFLESQQLRRRSASPEAVVTMTRMRRRHSQHMARYLGTLRTSGGAPTGSVGEG